MPATSWRDRLLLAVEYLRDNRALAMNVYRSLGVEYLGKGLERAIRPIIAEELQSIDLQLPISRDDEEFAISFFTYGVMGTIIQWLDDGMPENLDEIIKDLHALLHTQGEKTVKQRENFKGQESMQNDSQRFGKRCGLCLGCVGPRALCSIGAGR